MSSLPMVSGGGGEEYKFYLWSVKGGQAQFRPNVEGGFAKVKWTQNIQSTPSAVLIQTKSGTSSVNMVRGQEYSIPKGDIGVAITMTASSSSNTAIELEFYN